MTACSPENDCQRRLLPCLLAAILLCAVVSCTSSPEPDMPVALEDDLVLIPDIPSVAASQAVDFIGPDGCAECHQARCQEFALTSHFRASLVPSVHDMKAKLATGTEYRSGEANIRFRIEQNGDSFRQVSVIKTTRVERERSEQMALVFGGGNVDEIYHYWSGQELYQLPIAYINPLNNWGNAPGYEDGTAVFERAVEPRCLECHATHFTHLRGTLNSYRKDNFILGVSCERCHGSGREHRDFHRRNPDAGKAQHILHPDTISRERQIEVCTQCHGDASTRKTAPFSYVPGEPLADYFREDIGTFPEDDHTANQLAVLRESACFLNSSEMTCSTCHDPHVRRMDDLRAGTASCLTCHQAESCGGHDTFPTAVRGQCVSCHMPSQNVMNIWFSTAGDDFIPLISRASHKIGIDLTARDQVLLKWHGQQEGPQHRQAEESLRLALAGKANDRAARLRDEYRFRAAAGAYRDSLSFHEDQQIRDQFDSLIVVLRKLERDRVTASSQVQQGQFQAAVETLQGVLRVKPNDAMAHGRMGMALASMGSRDEGLKALQQVARHDPDLAYGENLIGWLRYQDKQGEEAVAAYERAIAVRPYNAQMHYQYGLALILLMRYQDARRELMIALQIDPAFSAAMTELRQLPRAD